MKPHYFRTLSKGVDVKHLKETKVTLEIPLEDRNNRLVKLGEIVDLVGLVEAITADYRVSLVTCESVETYLKKILALYFEGFVLALDQMILAILRNENSNLKSAWKGVFFAIINVDLWKTNNNLQKGEDFRDNIFA